MEVWITAKNLNECKRYHVAFQIVLRHLALGQTKAHANLTATMHVDPENRIKQEFATMEQLTNAPILIRNRLSNVTFPIVQRYWEGGRTLDNAIQTLKRNPVGLELNTNLETAPMEHLTLAQIGTKSNMLVVVL